MNSIIPEYEVKELPSRFVGYPAGTRIFTKPYTYGAALNIELVGRNNIDTMREILSGVRVEGMPKNLITPQDVLFLGLYRNLMSSMHDKIRIESYCPKCLNKNSSVASLKEIKFKDIDEFDASVYPLEVDFNNYTMWFEFVSYKDFEFCLRRYNGHKLYQLALQVVKYQVKETGEIFEKPNYNLDRQFTNIELYTKNVRDILYDFVDDDRDTLDEVCNILEDYGLKPIEVTCEDPHCGNKYTVNFNDENVLVLPFRETEKSPRNRIKLHKDDINESDRPEEHEPEGSGIATRPDTEASEQEERKPEPRKVARSKSKSTEQQITYYKDTK